LSRETYQLIPPIAPSKTTPPIIRRISRKRMFDSRRISTVFLLQQTEIWQESSQIEGGRLNY
jgi:hypothetical protein